MRLTVEADGWSVDIRIDRDDAETLTAAEQTALRFLAAAPPRAEQSENRSDQGFGYSVSADTERAPAEPDPYDPEDRT